MSYYQLLKVSPNATIQDLRQAFRTLSKLYHPDTTQLPPSEAAVHFQQLQQAYEILIDPSRRQEYDTELHSVELRRSIVSVVQSRTENSDRRPLSGGEWFAIILLCFSILACLLLALGLAWIRGVELIAVPNWLEESYLPGTNIANTH
uniref:DnaJ-like protein n=1 Tax=Paulinella chromatophora TaxID=39717 RepID=B1X3W7_PAUCH|nr:DnaJ-like protein [Paulinella chromatophora]ACB42636.1 DnaJ-like protein [Paulinella chromatophora]